MEYLDSALVLIKQIESMGYKAYIVGGAVRDYLLNNEINDIDIATSMPLELLQKDFDADNIGIDYLSIKIKYNNYQFDITRFRTDISYDDHRHPVVKYVDTLKEDISRRDFTINALAMDSNKKIIDYVNGINDLNNKIIKIIGNPIKRFEEDALRILRAIRFSSTLGFEIEKDTLSAMYELKDTISLISKERIKEELNKMICGSYFKDLMNNLMARDIFAEIIPEIKPSFDFNQRSKYHQNSVFNHLLNVMNNIEANYILRLTALFHDIGKPFSYQSEMKDGQLIYHFYGHEEKSKEIAYNALKRLHYSNKDIDMICWLVLYHDYKFGKSIKSVKKFLKYLPENNQDVLIDYLIKIKNADSSDHINVTIFDTNTIKENYNLIKKNNDCYNLKTLKINGKDIIDLGIDVKKINNILNDVLIHVIEDDLSNDKETLIKYVISNYK